MGLGRLELPTFYEARKVKFSVAGHTDPWGQFPIILTCPSCDSGPAAPRCGVEGLFALALPSIRVADIWPSTIFRVRSRATQGAWWGRLHLTLIRPPSNRPNPGKMP